MKFDLKETLDRAWFSLLLLSWEPVYDICRLQTADRRPQTADCRPQIADCKLNDTKNLPNKGDVFKNIKSCESEKVALGTRLIFLCKVTLASFPKCFSLLFTDPLSTHPAYH